MKNSSLTLKIKDTLRWQNIFAAIVLGMLLFYVIRLLVPVRWQDLYNAYGLLATGIMAGAWFAKRGFSGPVELKIYIAFVVWTLLSRWLNGDVYLFIDQALVVTALLTFLFLAYPTVLDEKGCSVFMDIVTVIYVGLFLPVAIAGIFVFLTDTYIHIPPENVWITIFDEGSRYTLNALSVNRLTAVARFFIAASLVIYQFVKRRNIVVRVLCILAYIPLHIAIGLCHGRATHIAMSLCFAMLMMLAFIPVFEKHKKPLRFVAVSIIAAVSLLVFYKSFDASNLIVDKTRNITAPRFEAYYNSLELKPNEDYFGLRKVAAEYAKAAAAEEEAEAVTEPETETETEAEPVPSAAPVEASAIDNRSIIGNWTFTGRTEIWQSGLIAISEDMGMMLKGGNSKDLMVSINHILTTRVNPTVTEYKYHMHNSYLMVLMLLGLPGFLLIMLWTVMMVIKMVKLFFSKKAGLADKYLTVPLAGVFVVSLAESFIFTAHDTVGLIFYLYAGVFLARYYEIMKD